MKIPTIHLNDTSADVLIEQHRAAITALQTALEVMAQADPNARDFYPQGDGAFAEAQRESVARKVKVLDAIREHQAICEQLLDQQGTIARQRATRG